MMKTIRKKSTPIRLGIIVLFYVAACVWITPHGFDMTDSGALLTQYAMPLDITRPISIGTFYTVWVGHWIHGLLPFGQLYVLSMLAWVLFAAEAVMAFRVFRRYLGDVSLALLTMCGVFMNKFFDLLGYNNWTIFWFIVMLALLDQWMRTERKGWLFAAGVIVGISVGFRLPNILQGLMVLGVFWYKWHGDSFRKAWGPALLYCGGAGVSLAAVWGSYAAFYGPAALLSRLPGYTDRLSQSEDTGYSAVEMLSALFGGLASGAAAAAIGMVAACLMAWAVCRITRSASPAGRRAVRSAAAVLLFAGMTLWIMDFTSEDTLNARRPSLCLIAAFSLVVCLTAAFLFAKKDPRFSTLCVFAVGMILIVTLGTNNGTLFFMMGMMYYVPAAAAAVRKIGEYLEEKHAPEWTQQAVFLTKAAGMALFCVLALFNFFTYEYVDGRAWDTTQTVDIPQLAGMKTTRQEADLYEEFLSLFQGCEGEPLLMYGSFPMGYYLSGMEPAAGQVWMDLDSYSVGQLNEALEDLEQRGEWPVIALAFPWWPDYIYAPEKWALLDSFAMRNGYEVAYQSETLVVYRHP